MGVYTRADSPFYWIHPEGYSDARGNPLREPTKIRHDAPTPKLRAEAKQLAQAAYHQRMLDLAREGSGLPVGRPAITFGAFVDWYETHELPKRRGAERERTILPTLRTAFGALPLTAIDRAIVAEWMTARAAARHRVAGKRRVRARTLPPPTAATINREVDVLKGILQLAVPKYLAASPLYGMKRLRALTPKRRVLSVEDEDKLLRVMSRPDKALFLMGLDTLARLGDILDAQWSDDQGDTLWIRDPKVGGGYAVPISARLRLALDALKGRKRRVSGYIFAHRRQAKTERDRRNGIRQMLERYCREADVPYGRAQGVTFHWATRRTGATRMLTNGVDPGTVQKVGRWKDPSVVLGIYHELIDAKARAAVEIPGARDAGVNPDRQTSPKSAKGRQRGSLRLVR